MGARRLADDRPALPTSGKNPVELGFGKRHQPSEYPGTPAVLFKCLTKFIQRDMAFLLQLGSSYEVPIMYPSILKNLRPAIMLPYVTFYSDKPNHRFSARWFGNSAVPFHIAWVGFCLVYQDAVTSCEVSALFQEYPVSPFSISLRCRHGVMDSKPVIHLFPPCLHRRPRWIPASLLAGGRRLAARRGRGACLARSLSGIAAAWGSEGLDTPYMI